MKHDLLKVNVMISDALQEIRKIYYVGCPVHVHYNLTRAQHALTEGVVLAVRLKLSFETVRIEVQCKCNTFKNHVKWFRLEQLTLRD